MKISFTKTEIDFFAESLKREVIGETLHMMESSDIINILNVDNKVCLTKFFKHLKESSESKKPEGTVASEMSKMHDELKKNEDNKEKQKEIKSRYMKRINKIRMSKGKKK
ncbi:hypothetical protein M0R19_08160 [Candidatus Pacearchaeota archaeon]|jgi:uncharacterized membrane-anchored protein YjiN (DUF445 family)|nr:hypothetical protein [bacterium]MCK9597131.1 hypothetical protein [Candidatus Pacearchaeota archaeon]